MTLPTSILRYFSNLAYCFVRFLDMFVNALTGGDPREFLSSRMGKLISANKCVLCKLICGVLNLIDPNHCVKSINKEVGSLEI